MLFPARPPARRPPTANRAKVPHMHKHLLVLALLAVAAAASAADPPKPRGEIVLTDCGSVGFCSIGVAVLVYPEGVWYGQVQAEDVPEIIEEHLEKGNVVERLARHDQRKSLSSRHLKCAPRGCGVGLVSPTIRRVRTR